MPNDWSWADLTETQRAQRRKEQARRKRLRGYGKSPNIQPDEYQRVREHILLLSQTMTARRIGTLAGVSYALVHDVIRGYRTIGHRGSSERETVKSMHRANYERIMKVQPEPVIGDRGPSVRAWPYARRLQALVADGFSCAALSHISWTDESTLWRIATEKVDSCAARTGVIVSEMYDKLAGTRPEDHGVTSRSAARARNRALQHGWAPSRVWDWDTLDDPEGIPEWTGACGTDTGYRIHKRDDIPACAPCQEAIAAYRRADHEKRRGRR